MTKTWNHYINFQFVLLEYSILLFNISLVSKLVYIFRLQPIIMRFKHCVRIKPLASRCTQQEPQTYRRRDSSANVTFNLRHHIL